jgi:hypothetical protein
MKIETCLLIAGGLISIAGVQAQIVSAEEDSCDFSTDRERQSTCDARSAFE